MFSAVLSISKEGDGHTSFTQLKLSSLYVPIFMNDFSECQIDTSMEVVNNEQMFDNVYDKFHVKSDDAILDNLDSLSKDTIVTRSMAISLYREMFNNGKNYYKKKKDELEPKELLYFIIDTLEKLKDKKFIDDLIERYHDSLDSRFYSVTKDILRSMWISNSYVVKDICKNFDKIIGIGLSDGIYEFCVNAIGAFEIKRSYTIFDKFIINVYDINSESITAQVIDKADNRKSLLKKFIIYPMLDLYHNKRFGFFVDNVFVFLD